MFHNPADFPFTRILEAHTEKIAAEARTIRHRMLDWLEKDLHDEGWQVFGLYNFPHGEPLPENIIHCPFTAALLAQHVPTHGAAGFSLLKPRSQIHPHRGYAGNFLRCHLPLVVPQGNCALRVQTETRPWHTGQCLIFDDRAEHEAWNLTDHPRIVLLLDFVPPPA